MAGSRLCTLSGALGPVTEYLAIEMDNIHNTPSSENLNTQYANTIKLVKVKRTMQSFIFYGNMDLFYEVNLLNNTQLEPIAKGNES